jgi:hypothetical protein
MAETATPTAGVDAEGMDDLGSLPRRTVAVKNRTNGQIIRQDNYLYEGGPGLDGWEQVIRYAVSHSKDYELLETLDGQVSTVSSTNALTFPDGSEITLAGLNKLHPKTRLKMIKDMGLDSECKGKTPRAQDEILFAAANSINNA